MTEGAGARIHDRRYQRYVGPRKGTRHATLRLAVHAFQRLLGLRRPFRYKVVPIVLGSVSYMPVVAFLGWAYLGDQGPPMGPMFAMLTTPVLLFVITVGPGGMIADRNSKSLSLYFASPLTRPTYLLAHAAALVAAICIVTLGPPLLYWAGSVVIVRPGLAEALLILRVTGKIVFCGVLIAAFYAAMTMAVASVTKRAAYAALLLFLIAGVLSGLLAVAVLEGASPYLLLVDPGSVSYELVYRVFGGERRLTEVAFHHIPMYLVAAATAGWAALSVAVTWFRYRRLVVSR